MKMIFPVRTVVVLVMAWGMAFITGTQTGIVDINKKKLDISDIIGTFYGSILVMLL